MNTVVELGLPRCGAGKIWRKAYATRSGKAVPGTCVTDQGAPGKGRKTLPVPREGALRGWQKSLPAPARRQVVARVAKDEGCGTALRRLGLLANFTKRTSPDTHKKAKADMAWLRRAKVCRVGRKKR